MPELPEVETIRRQLDPEITGRRIVAAEVLDERCTRPDPPANVERAISGRAIERVERRGKYLLVRLEGGRTPAMPRCITGRLPLGGGRHGPPLRPARLRLGDGRGQLFR